MHRSFRRLGFVHQGCRGATPHFGRAVRDTREGLRNTDLRGEVAIGCAVRSAPGPFIHEPPGVRFGPFRLDLQRRAHADCVPEKTRYSFLVFESERAQPLVADAP